MRVTPLNLVLRAGLQRPITTSGGKRATGPTADHAPSPELPPLTPDLLWHIQHRSVTLVVKLTFPRPNQILVFTTVPARIDPPTPTDGFFRYDATTRLTTPLHLENTFRTVIEDVLDTDTAFTISFNKSHLLVAEYPTPVTLTQMWALLEFKEPSRASAFESKGHTGVTRLSIAYAQELIQYYTKTPCWRQDLESSSTTDHQGDDGYTTSIRLGPRGNCTGYTRHGGLSSLGR